VIGLSILSGSHLQLVPEIVRRLREEGIDVPVVVGGIIPPRDADALLEAGVARVYTPKDFDINRIMGDIVELVAGPFKGEKARVMKIDETKEEITVELFEAMVRIPVTVRGDSVRVLQKEEEK